MSIPTPLLIKKGPRESVPDPLKTSSVQILITPDPSIDLLTPRLIFSGSIEATKGSIEGSRRSIEGSKGSIEGSRRSIEGSRRSIEGSKGSIEGSERSIEGSKDQSRGRNPSIERQNDQSAHPERSVDPPLGSIEAFGASSRWSKESCETPAASSMRSKSK